MAGTQKGATLDPRTHTKGAGVPDGDYILKTVTCDEFTYPDGSKTVPAIMVLYADAHDPSVTHEQAYSAGDLARLVPSDDKRRMVHPRGEAASYAGGSNASLWLNSIMKAGYEFQGDDVTQVQGMKVTITAVAQEKRPGLKDQKEGKTISLVSKILAMPGKAPVAAGRPTATASATPASTAAPANGSASASDLDSTAIQAVMQALEAAPEHSLKVKGLAVRCLKFAPGTKLNDLTKLITPEWLVAQADATGWTTDGEAVAL